MDLIRRYRRALNSGIARAATREADARGWDHGILQEVKESMATLLPAAEQLLQELEEEAKASWEDRAVFHPIQVTNLAGEAFKTLSENRWSRRDCMEYQDKRELDWVMRTFRRICDEHASQDARGGMGPRGTGQPQVSTGHEGRGETSLKLTEDGQRRAICRPETAVGTRESIEMSSTTSTRPRRGWSTWTPFPWTGGPPCRWPTSLERTDRSGPGRAPQEPDGFAPLCPIGA